MAATDTTATLLYYHGQSYLVASVHHVYWGKFEHRYSTFWRIHTYSYVFCFSTDYICWHQ